MNKKILLIFILFIILSILLSVALFLIGLQEAAGFVVDIMIAIGTCGTVIYAIFQSIPKNETITATCSFLPTDECFPMEMQQNIKIPEIIIIRITNIGNDNVILPNVLHVDIFANKTEWGNIDIDVENRRIILPKQTREFRQKLPNNKPLKSLVLNFDDLNIYTYAQNGNRIEIKRTKLLYTKPTPIELK